MIFFKKFVHYKFFEVQTFVAEVAHVSTCFKVKIVYLEYYCVHVWLFNALHCTFV